VITPEDAIRVGREHFLERSDIDMEAVAYDLDVSRATLYRVAESRDRLLGDVLWSFAKGNYGLSVQETDTTRPERVIEVLRRFGDRIFYSESFRRFLRSEPETAVRVLFTPVGRIHERFVDVNRDLLQSPGRHRGDHAPVRRRQPGLHAGAAVRVRVVRRPAERQGTRRGARRAPRHAAAGGGLTAAPRLRGPRGVSGRAPRYPPPMERICDRVLSWASLLDEKAREQAVGTAGVAAIHGHVALMPDAHWGMGATIGSVIPTREAIIPSAVGVDIGCGVIATETALSAGDLPEDLDPLLDRWAQHIPAGLGYWHAGEDPEWRAFVAAHGISDRVVGDAKLRDRAPRQFGTLGSGNHFLELCTDERDVVWLMLHSGSRGAGNQLAMRHIEKAKRLMKEALTELPDRDLAYFVQGTPEFETYVRDLEWAQAYAFGSRRRMMTVALRELAGLSGREPDTLERSTINNHHNYARREMHDGVELWVTRKGAISARAGELGVVPGSMGTGSFIVRGLGNPDSWMSAAHGAGRAMSRGEARRRFTVDDMERAMEGRSWLRRKARELIDEIPGAYKDLDTVMADQTDLVEVVHRLTTLVNYKGVEKGSRRGTA
jgi:tRNA-splicing ligase RtcB